jgi:hypothetical protein
MAVGAVEDGVPVAIAVISATEVSMMRPEYEGLGRRRRVIGMALLLKPAGAADYTPGTPGPYRPLMAAV